MQPSSPSLFSGADSYLTEQELLDFLSSSGILYQRYEHPAVYTCEQASLFTLDCPGAHTKNLFLEGDNQNLYLITTLESKRIDFKRLEKVLQTRRLRFGSPEKMGRYLGVEPGSVTMLSLINDHASQVRLLVDADLKNETAWQCHPLVNTSTLVITSRDMERFFSLTHHSLEYVEIPVKIDPI